MPVTSVDKDLEELTMTIVADFPVTVRRLWDAYADPRQLERFWGPPQWPATFTRHDFCPGGRSEYHMTGPDGTRSGGYWEFLSVVEGVSFEVLDGFTSADGVPDPEMPTMRAVFSFEETDSGARLTTTTYFAGLDQLEQLLGMGMEEGTRSAMAQIDDVLADLRSFAADRAAGAQLLGDTQVRISRVLRGTPRQIWDAHHDPELLSRWFHGPDGWALVSYRVASAPGEITRFEWAPAAGVEGEAFALTGEVLASDPPHREVFTETMEGVEGPPTHNEQTLTAVADGTLMTLVITYDSAELRDIILGTGMVEGMEAGYRRLETEVLAPG
ncbi:MULTISPECIES: SRPBCC family protein [unclassified Dietzia]|uniref:SRPBCC family protein n=1 Tax=unclassified Dietzia TaxID=2617939 RepID=UPI0015FB1026|nr:MULTISPECIES: SRPBCC family protein [unclassified Dietzia]MBB1025138.1 ATPase [Dietzia sp. DQ12-76]MBB1028296.1 ATPase [Dietzia sp. DQ11-38-2]